MKGDRGREAGERGKSKAHAARDCDGKGRERANSAEQKQSKQRRANSVEYDENNESNHGAGGEQHSGKFRDTQSEV